MEGLYRSIESVCCIFMIIFTPGLVDILITRRKRIIFILFSIINIVIIGTIILTKLENNSIYKMSFISNLIISTIIGNALGFFSANMIVRLCIYYKYISI